MTATPIRRQRAYLANTIKEGGVAGVPTAYYRYALDLNRFSNAVANKLLESYRRQIVKAVRELERIDRMPSSKRPEFKAARMRALIKQNLDSMRSWSKQSTEELIKQLDGLADVEVSFAQNELANVLPPGMRTSVRSVEVTESFAKSVVEAEPLDVGTNLLSQNIEEAVQGPGAALKLTARQGSIIRMPNGKSIAKSFRGLAESQGELFSRTVLDGLLTGESTTSIARSLYGELGFSTEALTARQIALAQKGNAWKLAKHQVRTLVQTSVNATSNAASLQVYKANQDITKKYQWLATLDSKTTAICKNLDGNIYEYGKGPTPASPPHFRCRSRIRPIVDWEELGVEPPPNTRGSRPTKEANPNSKDPEGGRVPLNTTAAQHIYSLRADTKSGGKSRFEASAAQARMLNGGKDTPGARQKARYFNRLADRYGPDGAMKRFMREDGSEVSLRELQSRYGDPAKITAAKAKAKPKPKPKPKTKPKPAAAAPTQPKRKPKAPLSTEAQREIIDRQIKRIEEKPPWTRDYLLANNSKFQKLQAEISELENQYKKTKDRSILDRLDVLEENSDDIQFAAKKRYRKLIERRGYLRKKIADEEARFAAERTAAAQAKAAKAAKSYQPQSVGSVAGLVDKHVPIASSTRKAGLSPKDLEKALSDLADLPGEAGTNAKAMIEFLERSDSTLLMTGKMTPAERYEIFTKNATFRRTVLERRSGQGADIVGHAIRKKLDGEQIPDLYEQRIDQFLKRFMLPPPNANGQAFKGFNFISVRDGNKLNGGAFDAKALRQRVKDKLALVEKGDEPWSFSSMPGRAGILDQPARDAESVMSTLIHEVGHVVQFMDETRDDRLGIRLRAKRKLTQYSGTNDREAFAEGFVAFVLQPEKLKEMRPELYDRIRRSLYEFLAK